MGYRYWHDFIYYSLENFLIKKMVIKMFLKKIILSISAILIGSSLFFTSANAMTPQQYRQQQAQKAEYQKQVNSYYQAGVNAYKSQNYQLALKYFEPIYNEYAKDKYFNIMVGDSFRNLNNFNNAITYLSKAYSLGSNDYITLTGLGYSYMDIQNYQQAYPYLKKATQIFPKQTDPYWNLGLTCVNLNSSTCAISSFRTLINIKPTYAPDPYVYLGDIYKTQNNAGEALNAYITGTKYFNRNPLLHFLAGDLFYINGKYDQAINYFLVAVDNQPDYLDAYYELGDSYLQLDDLDRATTVCSTMAKVNEKDKRTADLCGKVEQKRMQKMMEEQMMQEQMQRDIDQMNQNAMDMQAQQNATMGL